MIFFLSEIFLVLQISANGGKGKLKYSKAAIQATNFFSCGLKVVRPDESQFDSTKTLTLTDKAVRRICPSKQYL